MASFSSSSTVGIGGSHDLGGQEINDPVNVVDKPIFHWEKSIHALLVALASSVPPMITTDELRRAVENLEPISYMKWGYYDKWSAAIAVLLIERQIITEDDLNYEIEGESCLKEATKLFSVGDKVRVKIESSRLRWRRPHFRCPGYIFGMEGVVERYVGKFNDPFLLAFRGKGPKQHLYRVRFSMDDIWRSKYYGSVPPTCEHDSVDVEIYQDWLEFDPAFPRSSEINHEENVVVSSESEDQGTILEDNEDLSIFGDAEDYARKEVLQSYQDHDHSHDHDHHHHDHDHGHIHEGVDYRTVKANSHSSRDEVEMIASFQEGEDSPGKIVGMALLRLLHKKGIVTFAQITENIDKLDAAGAELNGAALVARAWVDPAFKARLMTDSRAAGAEMGINTSNSNAPTLLVVVEDTAEVHNVIVCTLCSCYPISLLGLSPSWYKSRSYRARMVREPRVVLKEFGTTIPENVSIRIHDSTADCRYLVIPRRPPGTEDMNEEELRKIITRDSMVGVRVLCPYE